MKKGVRLLVRFLLVLLTFIVVFFFWASSATLEERAYKSLTVLETQELQGKTEIDAALGMVIAGLVTPKLEMSAMNTQFEVPVFLLDFITKHTTFLNYKFAI